MRVPKFGDREKFELVADPDLKVMRENVAPDDPKLGVNRRKGICELKDQVMDGLAAFEVEACEFKVAPYDPNTKRGGDSVHFTINLRRLSLHWIMKFCGPEGLVYVCLRWMAAQTCP
jgi:DNA repair ATPase RecN